MLGITKIMDLMAQNIRNWKTLDIIPENAKISFDIIQLAIDNQIKYKIVIEYDYKPPRSKLELIEACMQETFGIRNVLSVSRLPSQADPWDVLFYPVEIVFFQTAQ